MQITSSTLRARSAAFTLIELLVVIAIIAILAAILFPVFARAKAAAKASVSLSNIKQTSLAILSYVPDYDDNFVLTGQWHSVDPDAYQRYPASPYMPWTGLVEPYMKNSDVFQSPVTGKTVSFTGPGSNKCATERNCKLLYPTYGYNPYLAPVDNSNLVMGSLSATAVVKPAEQVMLTEIWSRNNTGFGSLASGGDIAYISLATAEPPEGASAKTVGNYYARLSWGIYSATNNNLLGKKEEGMYRGGVAFRHADHTPTAFADGHVKSMTADQLAVGTDWVDGATNQAALLNDGKYLWDPRGR